MLGEDLHTNENGTGFRERESRKEEKRGNLPPLPTVTNIKYRGLSYSRRLLHDLILVTTI